MTTTKFNCAEKYHGGFSNRDDVVREFQRPAPEREGGRKRLAVLLRDIESAGFRAGVEECEGGSVRRQERASQAAERLRNEVLALFDRSRPEPVSEPDCDRCCKAPAAYRSLRVSLCCPCLDSLIADYEAMHEAEAAAEATRESEPEHAPGGARRRSRRRLSST